MTQAREHPEEQSTVLAGHARWEESIRPEWELLLYCARVSPDALQERVGALLHEGLDWAYLIQTALRHSTMPLLYQRLATLCPAKIPDKPLTQLQAHFRNNARRNFFLTGELLRCLHWLNSHGILAVPYKGPLLAAAAYGDFALRQFDDLDILLHEGDVVKARHLLVSQGYLPEFQLNRAQEAAYLRSQSAYKLVRDEGTLIIELHWRIVEDYFTFPLDPEQLWERLEPAPLAGKEVQTLSAEDLLLILCVHGTKHCWARLGWVCDVARLIHTRQEMDWEQIIGQANALGAERMLFLGLFLAHDLLGAALPEAVWKRMQGDTAAKSLAKQVKMQILRDTGEPPGILEASLFHLKARERWRDRVRYSIRLAITPTPGDWASVSLPSALFPLYYLLRPFRLVGAYAPLLAKRWLHPSENK
ncbi:MAG: nucleotidyltransferase family protein [Chloroflexi bacterium]|nr:nucleotidyltransferase family protein [Chloroflexota bacterium]